MAVNCGVSFGVCAIRITTVDATRECRRTRRTTRTSRTRLISIGLSPNIEAGNNFSLRNGCGCSLARFKANDVFNWFEFAFADGALEPEMMALMLGAETIVDGVDVVGLAFPGALDCSDDEPAVALEFWTKHIVGSAQDATLPWVHWVFPKTVWQLGDNTAEEDFMSSPPSTASRGRTRTGATVLTGTVLRTRRTLRGRLLEDRRRSSDRGVRCVGRHAGQLSGEVT